MSNIMLSATSFAGCRCCWLRQYEKEQYPWLNYLKHSEFELSHW